MQVKVIILPDGRMSANIEQGTYEQGKQTLSRFLQALGADGIAFDDLGKIEQHRHDTEQAHIHTHTEAHH